MWQIPSMAAWSSKCWGDFQPSSLDNVTRCLSITWTSFLYELDLKKNPQGLSDVKVDISMFVAEPNFPLILVVRRSILFQVYFEVLQAQLFSN